MVELPLPLELPEPMLPEPMLPLLEPELGAGAGVGAGEVVELPEVPPLAAPEPDLLKWASHSEREICPSLFVSTDEKFGLELLELDEVPDAPLAAPDELLLGRLDEPPVLEPDAAGEDEDEDLSALVLLDDELCATATLESANSAAAVAALRSFRFIG